MKNIEALCPTRYYFLNLNPWQSQILLITITYLSEYIVLFIPYLFYDSLKTALSIMMLIHPIIMILITIIIIFHKKRKNKQSIQKELNNILKDKNNVSILKELILNTLKPAIAEILEIGRITFLETSIKDYKIQEHNLKRIPLEYDYLR